MAGHAEQSKAEAVADQINEVLYETVLRTIKKEDEGPRHYYDVGVIGYGGTAAPALGGVLAGRMLVTSVELGNNPLRMAIDSSEGGTVQRPIWFESRCEGTTPMQAAMNLAGETISEWIVQHPDSFPPIVFNITDGASTDGDPRIWAERLRSLSTSDGNVLLFNLNVSSSGGPEQFLPSTSAGLPDEEANLLFEMSSELPEYMLPIAEKMGVEVGPGAKGFGYNVKFKQVISFLKIGTTPTQIT